MVKKIFQAIAALAVLGSVGHAATIVPYQGSTKIQDIRIVSTGSLPSSPTYSTSILDVRSLGLILSTSVAYTNQSNTFTSTQTINAQDASGFSLKTSSGINVGGCVRYGTGGGLQCAAPSTSTIVNLGNSGTGFAVNWSSSTLIYFTLTGNVTFAFSGGESGGRYTLALKQDGTGSRTVTWPASVRHSGGTAPTLTTTVAKTDYIGFIYNSVDAKYDLVSFAPNY